MVNVTNWAYDKVNSTVTEKDINTLAKAKRQEERDLKHGHRWVVINDRTKILVECDKKGNPTERGQRQIETAKKSFL